VVVPSEELKEESVADVEEAISNEMAKLNKHRPAYKRIIDYAISYEPLPRTTTKKIKKHILKEDYYNYKTGKFHFYKTSGSSSVKQSNEFYIITESIKELLEANRIKGVDQIEPSSRFHIDLGIDLMLLFELIEIIERKTDKGIPAEKLDTIESVGDLYLVLKEKGSASLKSESLLKRIAAVECITLSYTPETSKAKRLITDFSDNIYRTIMNPDVSGLENISDRSGMIILFNDYNPGVWFRIASALPDRIRRETVTLSKKEGRSMLIQSSGLKFADLPDTAYPGISILKQGFAALNCGHNLLIPLKQDKLFRETVFILNQTLNPVVPVITKHNFNSPSDFFRKKNKISVDFGRAVTSRDILRDRNISPYADSEITFDTITQWIKETFFAS
ncbi:MAG: non-ribosomal peptide synthetase, partial [Chitinivibrionales bacterium]